MADEQGWRDFDQITNSIDGAKGAILEINNLVNRLKHDKAAIMDDAGRLAEVTEIIGIHPLYSIAGLQADYTALVALQTFLIDNGYV